MHQIFANHTASITELKRNPNILLDESSGNPIAILNHNQPVAYLIPANTYEALLDALEDKELIEIIASREHEYNQAIKVDMNDL